MRLRLLIYFFLAMPLAGCAPWQTVGGRYTGDQGFEVALPDGWHKYNRASESLLITKDGTSLQQISIDRRAIDKELPFTKKQLAKGMLPQEAAEVIIDNFRSNSKIRNQEVLENVPRKIDGNPGFRLTYVFDTDQGLKKQGIYYGFIAGDSYYLLVYEAPARYYFARDLAVFEKVKESFRLNKRTAT